MLARRVSLLLCCVACLSSCGSRAASDATAPLTLPIGELPSSLPPGDSDPPAGSVGPTTTLPRQEQVGARAKGNRVIIIGDSVTASTSQRYSNDTCEALVPLGWQTEVDAESGRFIEFGNRVLDQRLKAGWDTSVILLGNNYIKNQDQYRQQLERIVTRLSPNPIVLITVTEFTPTRRDVNAIIHEMARLHSNVQIIDWATITKKDLSLTGGDHLHLTPSGRKTLAANIALSLGTAPKQPGKCLPTKFTDDSMMPVTGTSAPGSGGSGGSGNATTTTHRAATSTTSEAATSGDVTTTKPASTSTTTAPKVTPPTTTVALVSSLP